MADAAGTNIAVDLAPASRHEVKLVSDTLDARHVSDLPRRLIGDKAYDSDPLDEDLAKRGIEMKVPCDSGYRGASEQLQQTEDAGKCPAERVWAETTALQETVEDRAAVRALAELQTVSGAL